MKAGMMALLERGWTGAEFACLVIMGLSVFIMGASAVVSLSTGDGDAVAFKFGAAAVLGLFGLAGRRWVRFNRGNDETED